MSEISNLYEDYQIRPGERLTVLGASESKLLKRNQSKRSKTTTDIKILELEYQNKVLVEKMSNYEKILVKESEMVSKETNKEMHQNNQSKSNKTQNNTPILPDPLASNNMPIDTENMTVNNDMPVLPDTISTIAEFQNVRHLLQRIATLQIRNNDLIHENENWELRWLKMKMKYDELKNSKLLFSGLINTSKQMANAIQEFKNTKSINRHLTDTIDLKEFNDMISKFENQIKEDFSKNNENPKRIQNFVKIDIKDLEITDKIIKSLQQELEIVKTNLALEKQKNNQNLESQLNNFNGETQNALDVKTDDILKTVDMMLQKVAIDNEKEKKEILQSLLNGKNQKNSQLLINKDPSDRNLSKVDKNQSVIISGIGDTKIKTEDQQIDHNQFQELQNKFENTEKKLKKTQHELDISNTKYKEIQTMFDEIQQKLKKTQQNLDFEKEIFDEVQQKLKKTQQNLDFEKEIQKDTQFHLDESEKQLEKTQKKLMKTEFELETTQKNLDEIQSKLKEKEIENEKIQNQLNGNQKEYENVKMTLQENIKKKEDLMRLLEENEMEKNELIIKLEHSEKKEESIQQKLNASNSKIEKIENENSKLKKQIIDIQSTVNNLKKKLNDLQIVLDDKNTTLSIIQDQQTTFNQQLNEGMLKESMLTKSMFESVLVNNDSFDNQTDENSVNDKLISKPKNNEIFELKETLKQAYNKLNELNVMAANVALSNKKEQNLKGQISDKLKTTEEQLNNQILKINELEKDKLIYEDKINLFLITVNELKEDLKRENEEKLKLDLEFKNHQLNSHKLLSESNNEVDKVKQLLKEKTDELTKLATDKIELDILVEKMRDDFAIKENELNTKFQLTVDKLNGQIQELNDKNSIDLKLQNSKNVLHDQLVEKLKTEIDDLNDQIHEFKDKNTIDLKLQSSQNVLHDQQVEKLKIEIDELSRENAESKRLILQEKELNSEMNTKNNNKETNDTQTMNEMIGLLNEKKDKLVKIIDEKLKLENELNQFKMESHLKQNELSNQIEKSDKINQKRTKELENDNYNLSQDLKNLKMKNEKERKNFEEQIEKLKESLKTEYSEKMKIQEEFIVYKTDSSNTLPEDSVKLMNYEKLVKELKDSIQLKNDQIESLENTIDDERKNANNATHYLDLEKENNNRLETKVNQLNNLLEKSRESFEMIEKQKNELKRTFEQQEKVMEDKIDALTLNLTQTQNQLSQKLIDENIASKKFDKLQNEYQTLNQNFDLITKNLEESKIDITILRKNEGVFNEIKKKLFEEIDRERKRNTQLEIALKVTKKSKDDQLKQSKINIEKSNLIDASMIAKLPNEYQMNDLRNKIDELKLQLQIKEKELENSKQLVNLSKLKIEDKINQINALNVKIEELELIQEKYQLSIPLLKYGEELKIQNQEILDLKSEVEKELILANQNIQQIQTQFNDYKISVSANDKSEFIANLESNNRKLSEDLKKTEGELLKLTNDGMRLKTTLENDQKKLKSIIFEKDKLEIKLKDAEELALNSRVRKYGLDHEFQNYAQNNQRLKESNDDLQLRLKRELLKNEHLESKANDLQNQLNSLSKDSFEIKKLEANLVLKNQQIFDMLSNSNSKQNEFDALKIKVSILENRLKSIVQKNNRGSVQLLDDEVINVKLDEMRHKLNISTNKYKNTKEELVNAYNKILNSSNENNNSITDNDNTRLKHASDEELERKIENFEKEVEKSLKRENEYKEISKQLEEKLMKIDSINQDLQKSLVEKAVKIQELESCKIQNEFKITKLKNEQKEFQRQLIEKEKEIIKAKVAVNKIETEMNSKSVLTQIAESKLSEIANQKQSLIKQLQDKDIENNKISDEAYRAFHDLLNQYNEEKDQHENTKTELTNALQKLSKSEKITNESQSIISTKNEEIKKIELQLSNQRDRIELLTRVSKLNQDEIKDLIKLGDSKLEKDYLAKQLKDALKKLDDLSEDLEDKVNDNNELTKQSKLTLNEVKNLKNEIETLETELNKTRVKLIQKNNSLNKLQDEYLLMKLQRDKEETDFMLLKIKNSEVQNQMSFMMKQIQLFDVKNKAYLSFNEFGTQTEENNQNENENENENEDESEYPDAKLPINAVKLLREFRMKMKVKNDQIQQLTENFELLEKQVSSEGKIKRVGKHFMNEEDWITDQKEKKLIKELESKIEFYQNQIRGKEVFENELMELIEQKRAFEGFKNQIYELLKEESENNKIKADKSIRDLFKSQVTVSEYILQVNKLREEKKQMERTYNERENVIKTLEIDLLYEKKMSQENQTKAERMRIETEIGLRLENVEKKRRAEEILELKKQIKKLEEIIDKDLKGEDLKNEFGNIKEQEKQGLENKNQQLLEKFSAQKQLVTDIEILKKENWSVKSKLDNTLKETEYLKKKIPELENQLTVTKQQLVDQNHKTSLLTLSFERDTLEHANQLQFINENHKKDIESLNLIINNQREILKRNYKIYASKVNLCNREIKDLKTQLSPNEPVDYERELRTSLLLEELFEKEHELGRVSSNKQIHPSIIHKIDNNKDFDKPHQSSSFDNNDYKESLDKPNQSSSIKKIDSISDNQNDTEDKKEKPKFTSKLLKALEEDMKTQSIKEEDNEDAGSVDVEDELEHKIPSNRSLIFDEIKPEINEIGNFKKKIPDLELN